MSTLLLSALLACNPTPRSQRTAEFSDATGLLEEWSEGNCDCRNEGDFINVTCKSWDSTAIEVDVLQFIWPEHDNHRVMRRFHWQVRQNIETSDLFSPGPIAGPAEISVGPSDGEAFDLYIHELAFHETTGCSWDGMACQTKGPGTLVNGQVRCQDLR